jgi:hypothetical protein
MATTKGTKARAIMAQGINSLAIDAIESISVKDRDSKTGFEHRLDAHILIRTRTGAEWVLGMPTAAAAIEGAQRLSDYVFGPRVELLDLVVGPASQAKPPRA